MHNAYISRPRRSRELERGVPVETAPHTELEDALRRNAELHAALTRTTETLSKTSAELKTTSAALATVTAERDKLRHAYEQLKGQLELLRRRIFLAKAERIDTRQLEIEFAETKAKLDKLTKELDAAAEGDGEGDGEGDNDTAGGDDGRPARTTKKSKGRRNLRELDMPEERVEILDPALEGKAERIGFEETCFLGRRRGGPVRIVMARATYKVTADTYAHLSKRFLAGEKNRISYAPRPAAKVINFTNPSAHSESGSTRIVPGGKTDTLENDSSDSEKT